MRTLIALVLCAAVSLSAGAQEVDVDAELQRIFGLRGVDDAGARDQFRELYAQTSDVRALAQQALAEAEIGEHAPAAEHLWTVLAVEHEWVDRNREQLESVVERESAQVVRVDVTGPAGTRITVGGDARGALPLGALAVTPGTIRVVATYEDGSIWDEERELDAGERWSVDVPQPPEPDDGTETDDPQTVRPPSGRSIVGPAIGLGVGGALTVAGAVMLGIGNAFINDVEGSEPGTDWVDVRGKANRGETLTLVGFIGIGVGVAALTASLIWLLVSDDEDDDRRARWLGRFRF